MPTATATDRSALIRQSTPRLSRAYSAAASEIVDQFQLLASDAKDLDPAEELRLLAEIQRQIAARIVDLASR
jgi:hypothetical protein